MIRIFLLIAFIFLHIGCSLNHFFTDKSMKPELDDYIIYQTFLKIKNKNDKENNYYKVLLFETTSLRWDYIKGDDGTFEEFKVSIYNYIKRSVPLTEDTFQDYVNNNNTQISLKQFKSASKNIYLLTSQEWHDYYPAFLRNQHKALNKKYSKNHIGPYKLSRVGFNKDNNQAILYVEGQMGGGWYYFEKENDIWKSMKYIGFWIN